MNFRLKTSKNTLKIFSEIEKSTHLKPFILSKLAIVLSVKSPESIERFQSDNYGMELNRQTITGPYDKLYKCLIEQHCGRHLLDEEYFPTYIKKHLDRGAELLYREFNFTKGYKEFLVHLIKLEESL